MGVSPMYQNFDFNSWMDARRRKAINGGVQTPTITQPFSTFSTPYNTNLLTGATENANMFDQSDVQAQARAKAAADAYRQASIDAYNKSANSSTNQYAPIAQMSAATNVPTGPAYQTGSSTKTAPATGDVMDGFARRYLGLEADTVLQNPEIISQDLLGSMGRGQLAGDASRYANAAPALYNLLVGGNQRGDVQSNQNIINWVAKLMTNMSTVGGAAPTQSNLLAQLYAGLKDPNSTIGGPLFGPNGTSAKTSQEEVDYINKMLPLVSVFTNYNAANSQKAIADRLGQEYLAAKAKGGMNNVSYSQYLQDNFLR